MSYVVDLHTHSYGSSDGGLTLRDYRYFLKYDLLDFIAITDHNRIDIAQRIKLELGERGSRIIIGEEVMCKEGEIIGLYLKQTIEPGMSALKAARAIHGQGGLVYVPHPFETIRSGLTETSLEKIASEVDIIETRNGRAVFQNRSREARCWAGKHELPGAASSDSHGRFGWGHTYSVIAEEPTVRNLIAQLHIAEYSTRSVGLGVIYPSFNRLKKKVIHR